ncbi:TRAP transporter solute receptor, TAXI family [Rhodopirellula islandica]|uniref:TRAP transporter solute receptor, TAXI family n=1 Tax=Rhodopirellula islandica TaxID=595434 RepID=A0A0J1BGY0_RHOIS|nr:TAXI family TRAP transporter solute-binding subunit [Rhodopirellula islandica]KLU05800.1 TRAP transporter solute receptor, TAXI family [Rhodopirellula islandica]
MSWTNFLLALFGGLICWVAWIALAGGTQHQTVVISTGSEQGIYFQVGKEIGDSYATRHPAVRCEVVSSEGSHENVTRLQNGTADVAILQNDAVADERVRSLAMLYTEVLHLVCRKDAGIQCLNDLAGHPTNLGSQSGGTHSLVEALLRFSRVQIPTSQQLNLGFSDSAEALRSGDVDAAFFLVGLGSEIIQDLIANPEFELVPIQIRAVDSEGTFVSERAFIDGFRTHYPHAEFAEIPLMSYEGSPTSPTPSVGIGAVLACRASWEEELASDLVQTLFAHRAVLGRKISLLSGLDEQSSQTQLQFPLHRGAEAYFRRNEPGYLAENAESIGVLITVALLLASGLHGLKKWIDQKRKNRVDVYYGRVQQILDSLGSQGFSNFGDALRDLEAIESTTCQELIEERLDADHSFVILQNMIHRCRAEIERAAATAGRT